MPLSRTSTTLLEALREPADTVAWSRFDARYRPVLLEFARRLGLSEHDAEDVTQKATVTFCKAHREGRYERTGRLRNWLLSVVRNEIRHFFEQQRRQPLKIAGCADPSEMLAVLEASPSLSRIWEREWEKHVVEQCLDRLDRQFSTRDVRIFRMLALRGESTDAVAGEVGLSCEAVRQVKHRVLNYMRSIRDEIELGV